jgi:hypothetical protein
MRHLLAILITATVATTAHAEPAHLDVETDPSGWVLDGYSVHAGYRPAELPHWRFEAGSYGLAFPHALIDLNATNKGWDVSIVRAVAVQVAWYVRDDARGGLFVGGSVAAYDERDALAGMSSDRWRSGIQPVVGYQWFPFAHQSFYIKPWAGLGIVLDKGDAQTIAGRTFDVATVSPFATLHVGFQL